MTNQEAREYTFQALTDLWTGDADGKSGRTITTGLLGSIRWWFEVLVRGLGGKACDPTKNGNPCPDQRKNPTEPGHHCVVCELFGCTGWARKFRFEVLDANGKAKAEQITKGQTFKLRFTPLRPILPQEWALLDRTLRLIAEYGAIGGKTVLKPSDEQDRANKPHHCDYGLIRITEPPASRTRFSQDQLEGYISQDRWRRVNHGGFAWASLEHFWCVKGRYLARQNANTSTFNRVIGRPEAKGQSSQGDSWLAGRRAGGQPKPQDPESKKVLSFKSPREAVRTFGFVQFLDELKNLGQELKTQLEKEWAGFDIAELKKKPDILDELFKAGA
jgi:CRISPR-associated protein Cmr1